MTPRAAAISIDQAGYRTQQGKLLLHPVRFTVSPGEIIAIAGPNGAGKSTLLSLLCGLNRPTTGDIYIDGISLTQLSHRDRAKRIALVAQNEQPDPRLSVRDYVELGTICLENSAGLSDQALSAAGLQRYASRRLGALSGGELQRAKIARAICQRPGLLLLDEPTNHLDPRARGDLLGLTASLGVTVIATLHELALIDAFADQVLVLADGQAIAFGPPQEALARQVVRDVFDVDHHRLSHPLEDRLLPTLDIDLPRVTSPFSFPNKTHKDPSSCAS